MARDESFAHDWLKKNTPSKNQIGWVFLLVLIVIGIVFLAYVWLFTFFWNLALPTFGIQAITFKQGLNLTLFLFMIKVFFSTGMAHGYKNQ